MIPIIAGSYEIINNSINEGCHLIDYKRAISVSGLLRSRENDYEATYSQVTGLNWCNHYGCNLQFNSTPNGCIYTKGNQNFNVEGKYFWEYQINIDNHDDDDEQKYRIFFSFGPHDMIEIAVNQIQDTILWRCQQNVIFYWFSLVGSLYYLTSSQKNTISLYYDAKKGILKFYVNKHLVKVYRVYGIYNKKKILYPCIGILEEKPIAANISLSTALKKFPSLQYRCRTVILSHLNENCHQSDIDKLKLPQCIKQFLIEDM